MFVPAGKGPVLVPAGRDPGLVPAGRGSPQSARGTPVSAHTSQFCFLVTRTFRTPSLGNFPMRTSVITYGDLRTTPPWLTYFVTRNPCL